MGMSGTTKAVVSTVTEPTTETVVSDPVLQVIEVSKPLTEKETCTKPQPTTSLSKRMKSWWSNMWKKADDTTVSEVVETIAEATEEKIDDLAEEIVEQVTEIVEEIMKESEESSASEEEPKKDKSWLNKTVTVLRNSFRDKNKEKVSEKVEETEVEETKIEETKVEETQAEEKIVTFEQDKTESSGPEDAKFEDAVEEPTTNENNL